MKNATSVLDHLLARVADIASPGSIKLILLAVLLIGGARQVGAQIPWDEVPEALIRLRIVNGTTSDVVLVSFVSKNERDDSYHLIAEKRVFGNILTLTKSEIGASDLLLVGKIERINFLSNEGSLVGHVALEYSLGDYNSGRKVDANVYIHPDLNGHYDSWDYYANKDENTVSMLVPPRNQDGQDVFGEHIARNNPVLFVHGVSDFYKRSGNGSWKVLPLPGYDAWQFYYPYDQSIDSSAVQLDRIIKVLLDNIDGLGWGYSSQSGISIVAHSMGGLVTRTYIQSDNYGEEIHKFLMLGTPNHGSHASHRLIEGKLSGGKDKEAPAYAEMIPGSSFLYDLNQTQDTRGRRALISTSPLVVAGTRNICSRFWKPECYFGFVHDEIEGQDDGVVAVSSASMLNWEIPLATVHIYHSDLKDVTPVDIITGYLSGAYEPAAPPFMENVNGYWESEDKELKADDHLENNKDSGILSIKTVGTTEDIDGWKVRFDAEEYSLQARSGIGFEYVVEQAGSAGHYFVYDRDVYNDLRFLAPERSYVSLKLGNDESLPITGFMPFRHLQTTMLEVDQRTGRMRVVNRPPPKSYTDVNPDDWYAPYVEVGTEAGFIDFPEEGVFRPGARVTRAEIAKQIAIARRELGLSLSTEGDPFNDVPPSHPYFRYIQTLKEAGIIDGVGGNDFGPDLFVTRGELAKFIANGFELPAVSELRSTDRSDRMQDLEGYNPNLVPHVQRVVNTAYGDPHFHTTGLPFADFIVSGKQDEAGDPIYDPKGQVNRAELAKFVVNGYRFALSSPLDDVSGARSIAALSSEAAAETAEVDALQIVGTNYEQTAAVQGRVPQRLTFADGSTSLTLSDNRPFTLNYSNATDSDGDDLFFYWTVDDGEIGSTSPNNQSIRFDPPLVAAPTDVRLYTLAGDGEGNIARGELTLTVVPGTGRTGKPDLIAEDPDVRPSQMAPGEDVQLRVRIRNIGDEAAGPSQIGYYLSRNGETLDENDERLHTDDIGSILPDQTSIREPEVAIPSALPEGTYHIVFRVDDGAQVDEAAEDNNVQAVAIVVGEGGSTSGADLVVQNVQIDPETIIPGGSLLLLSEVVNTGDVATLASGRLGYYLSNDDRLDETDALLATTSFGSILPGGRAALERTLVLPVGTPLGEYHLLFYADHAQAVPEANEENNLASVPLTVTYDARMTVFTPNSASNWGLDRTYTITWTSNLGGTVAIDLYKSLSVERSIARGVANSVNGTYVWTVPGDLFPADHYEIRVTSESNPSVFDHSEDFTISYSDVITVLTPNGAEAWGRGTTQNVTWRSTFAGTVDIDLYQGGQPIRSIASSVNSPRTRDGTYGWRIPADLPEGADYQIGVRRTQDAATADLSDGFFRIVVPDPDMSPVVVEDAALTLENTAVTIPVLANDNPPPGASLVISALTEPLSGQAVVDPGNTSVTYTPEPGFVGADFFTYTVLVADEAFTATVFVTVQPAGQSDAPWLQQAGGRGADAGTALALDAAGNSYVLGTYQGAATLGTGAAAQVLTGNGVFVAKYDPQGRLLWVQKISASEGNDLVVDEVGNVYLTGSYNNVGTFYQGDTVVKTLGDVTRGDDAFVAKYNPLGTFIWAQAIGGNRTDSGDAIALDVATQHIYVGGYFDDVMTIGEGAAATTLNGDDVTMFVAKFSTEGTLVRADAIEVGAGFIFGMAIDATGALLLTGLFEETVTFGAHTLTGGRTWDIYLAKYDATGTAQWAQKATGAFSDGGNDLAVDADGMIYLVGFFDDEITLYANEDPVQTLTSRGIRDVLLAKYDDAGRLLWARQAGGPSYDAGQGLTLDQEMQPVITGFFEGTATFGEEAAAVTLSEEQRGVFVARFDEDGTLLEAKQSEGSSLADGQALAIGPTGDPFVTGWFENTVRFDGAATLGPITSAGNRDLFLVRLGTADEQEEPNRPPLAKDDEAETHRNQPVVISVLENDTDLDGDALVLVTATQGEQGAVAIDAGGRTLTYMPASAFAGVDRFEYTVADDEGATSQASVTVRILNRPPSFTSHPVFEGIPGLPYLYAVRSQDVDGDSLVLTAPVLPSWLSVAEEGNGTGLLQGTPRSSDLGSHRVVLRTSDGDLRAEQSFLITVADSVPPGCPWTATPTNTSGVFLGQATLRGRPVEAADCLAAIDSGGTVAGVAGVTQVDSLAFLVGFTIYGDDPTTADTDEGINAEESFSLHLFDASSERTHIYEQTFACWQNMNGAPLPGCNDPQVVYDFSPLVQQPIALAAGWNLTSLRVRPDSTNPAVLFAPVANSLRYLTGFDCARGAAYYDPTGLSFLNTLNAVEPGMGYWVKTGATDSLTVTGVALMSDREVALCKNWNLLGYWPSFSTTPEEAFRALIDSDKLIYATGFDETGAKFFDPNGLPFLNTLRVLKPGGAYWLKLSESTEMFRYPDRGNAVLAEGEAVPGEPVGKGVDQTVKPTNRFMFVQGQAYSDGRPAAIGKRVEAVSAQGLTVGESMILEDGHILTMAIYGDDPQTPERDGAEEGEAVFFRYEGNRSQASVPFSANTLLRTVVAAFEEQQELPAQLTLNANYPNPFGKTSTIRYGLPVEQEIRIELYDGLGRRVRMLVNGRKSAGWHEVLVSTEGLANGVYIFRLIGKTAQQTGSMVVLK